LHSNGLDSSLPLRVLQNFDRVCNGDKFSDVYVAPPPPPTNCKELKETEDQHNSGVYAVDCELTGQRTCNVYCEMTKAGGGWTLLINLETSDGTRRDWDDTTFWTGPAARHRLISQK